ncbi:MAG: non-heme iron oxygenase ferredoxin subunit, partial [Candidatus Dormibacteraceae bacterium]
TNLSDRTTENGIDGRNKTMRADDIGGAVGGDELEPDSMRRVIVDGIPVCLVRTEDGQYFAIQDTCTHEEFSLSEGELWGYDVECPAHGSRFDVRTGAVRNLPAVTPARAYPVTRVDGEFHIDVSAGVNSD